MRVLLLKRSEHLSLDVNEWDVENWHRFAQKSVLVCVRRSSTSCEEVGVPNDMLSRTL